MRILYSAIDQTVPGTVGGSVHVGRRGRAGRARARGARARHAGRRAHSLRVPCAGSPMPPPLGRKELRWARRRAVARLAREIRPDAVIERYYNFGGEGILAARGAGRRGVLEVNAPVIDYPGSRKAILDRALLVEPMRRWRERICRSADVIVTPSAAILPADTPSSQDRRARVGRRHRPVPTRRAEGRCRSRGRPGRWRCSPARSGAGTARSISYARSGSCASAA